MLFFLVSCILPGRFLVGFVLRIAFKSLIKEERGRVDDFSCVFFLILFLISRGLSVGSQ